MGFPGVTMAGQSEPTTWALERVAGEPSTPVMLEVLSFSSSLQGLLLEVS